MKARLLILLLLALPLLGIFAPALTGRSSFAFRDSAFYHPMFEYVRQEWGAGRVPLWNPYENLGVPLLAENTSSIFYPGKLLFALPLDYTLLYNWYIVAHVALAAWTSYRLARHFGASGQGAGLAALSYAFCGNVVFQVCNVVFLVGAAWLPLALLAADRMLRERRAASAVGFGTILTLIVLGGDPQLAYNVVIVVALYGLLLWWNERRMRSEGLRPEGSVHETPLAACSGWLAWRPVLLGMSLAVAGLLSAVQVLPTLEASPYSGRSRYDSPRSVYELATTLATRPATDNRLAWYDGFLGSVHRGHTTQIYAFSVPPWRLVELLWPNASGAPFPTHRRWFGVLLPEGNLWAASLYMGLLPILLAASSWTLRRMAPVQVRFLSWLVVFGIAGSLGIYGPAWLVGSIFGGADLLNVGGEVGGLYWWLTVLLPSYVSFRYSAKLFILASIALSVLAARGWDDMWLARKRRRFYVLVALAILSLAIMPVVSALWPRLAYLDERMTPSSLLGPMDWGGAWRDIVAGSLQTCILATAIAGGLLLGWRRPGWRPALQVAALGLTAFDLLIAQTPLVLYASTELLTARPKVLDLLGDDFREWRVYRQQNVLPAEWEVTSSEQRYDDCVSWDRETLWPKYPVPYHVPMSEAPLTIAAEDYQVLLEIARQHSKRNNRGPLPAPEVLDLVSSRQAIVMEGSEEGLTSIHELPLGMRLGTRPTVQPRAWIARRVENIAPPASSAPFVVQRFTQALFFPDNKARDWHVGSVIESSEPVALPVRDDAMAESESCHLVSADPQRVEIDVRLAAPGLVVLGDLFYPGWEATLETAGGVRPLEMVRTNRVMRGVVVPAGTHRIVYRYRPRSVLVGGILSAMAALALVGLAMVRLKRRGLSSLLKN